jgi:hypothetical protein
MTRVQASTSAIPSANMNSRKLFREFSQLSNKQSSQVKLLCSFPPNTWKSVSQPLLQLL